MRNIYISVLTLLFGTMLSCDSFLEVQPKGYTIPAYYDDYAKLLNNIELSKFDLSVTAFLTDDVQVTNGDSLNNYSSKEENERRLYSFVHGPVYNEGESDILWEKAYYRIYTFNTVINNIMKVTDATEENKKRLHAQALVGRAFEYLNLVALYAKAYDPLTAASDWGVPLVISEDVGQLDYRRNSVQEVYDKIKEDLEAALPYLSLKPEHSFKPSKGVADALLAKMYLRQRKYAEALDYALAAMQTNTALIDLNQYGIRPGNVGIGRICKLPALTEPYPEGIDNAENIYTRYMPYVFGLSQKVFASADLLAVYAKDIKRGEVDKRRSLWFSDDKFLTYVFQGRTLFCAFTRVNVGLNNPDLMLMAAESYLRVKGEAGLKDAELLYNQLRKHRIANYQDRVFQNAEEALVKVLDERRREFAFLGSYRIIDLKRLNQEDKFKKTITHTADGNSWTLAPNDLRYVLPIPPKVKAINTKLPDYER